MSSIISPVNVPPKKTIDTTRQAIPFDTANIPGPKMARAVMPAVSGKMIEKARKPLLIVGSQIHDKDVLERVIAFGRSGIEIAAVGDAHASLWDEKLNIYYANLHVLTSYLCNPDWTGFDEKGRYDLVAFFGITYYYASQAMSSLKNFSDIKVISIDRYYHPNADVSFGNLNKEVFIEALDQIIALLQKS
ncbi:MAG: CO dehydrogenase/acetyl-CoA synthase complex subunit epsilon [ANME-2 cluster archaeon]|nr:MAG: CO dehydrogenase/acetyl-CoA synthase complex subunit epsilon [ANME-2 cluster archaeon]